MHNAYLSTTTQNTVYKIKQFMLVCIMSHSLGETIFSWKAIHLKRNCFIFIHFLKHEKN